jgi:hypothetical protein
MQAYWLEGGSPTFWFQPLYRGLMVLTVNDPPRFEVYALPVLAGAGAALLALAGAPVFRGLRRQRCCAC